MFPHSENIAYAPGKSINYKQLLDILTPQITSDRLNRMQEVIDKRSYSIVPVLEKVWDQGNINAVLRTAESFGMQSLHIIEVEKHKKANRVSKGAHKWLDLNYHSNSTECAQHLKQQGYQILATHLSPNAVPIQDLDFSKPTAFVLGSEGAGVSPEMLQQADQHVLIPMQGFTQSFNISVAAAISFYCMYQDKKNRLGKFGDLSLKEKEILKAVYVLRSIPDAEKKITNLLKNN